MEGITAHLGLNASDTGTFTPADALQVYQFGQEVHAATLSFWSINKDFQPPYNGTFTNIFLGKSPSLTPFTPNYTDLGGFVTQIATTTNANGTLTVFGIGSGGAVYYRQENSGDDPTSFGPWTSLGGFAKGLAVVPQGSGLPPAVFVIGSDNAVWVNETLTKNDWHSLGGIVSQVTAALDGNGNLEVFGIGTGNVPYVNIQTSGTSFGGWQQPRRHRLPARRRPERRQRLDAPALRHRRRRCRLHRQADQPGNARQLHRLELAGRHRLAISRSARTRTARFSSSPSAPTTAPGPNKQTAIGNYTSAGFTGWNSLGGIISDLTVARNSDGTLQFFGIGGGGAIYSQTQSTPGAFTAANFSGYQNFGGIAKQVVAGTNLSNQTVQFFVIGSDNARLHQGPGPPGAATAGRNAAG